MAPNHDLIRDVNIMRGKVSYGKELRSPLKSLRTLELLSPKYLRQAWSIKTVSEDKVRHA